jgi:hypothetical protein
MAQTGTEKKKKRGQYVHKMQQIHDSIYLWNGSIVPNVTMMRKAIGHKP